MRIEKTDIHSRCLRVVDIPGDVPELYIEIRYRGQGGAFEGIALDHHVVPAILKAFAGPHVQFEYDADGNNLEERDRGEV